MADEKTVDVRIKQKYDTSTNWAINNPTLLAGEIGIESDTNKIKIGTGNIKWNDLPYIDNDLVHKTGDENIEGLKNFSQGIKINGGTLDSFDEDLFWNNLILSTRLDNLSNADIIFNTSTSSSGTYNFINGISNYAFLCFAYYNNRKEYCYMVIPTIGFKLTTSSRKVFLNSSSAENTRFVLLHYLSDTSFVIDSVASCTLRFIYGIPT